MERWEPRQPEGASPEPLHPDGGFTHVLRLGCSSESGQGTLGETRGHLGAIQRNSGDTVRVSLPGATYLLRGLVPLLMNSRELGGREEDPPTSASDECRLSNHVNASCDVASEINSVCRLHISASETMCCADAMPLNQIP
ncbi:unnamed protein product [Arctogadus glacialis]